MEPQVTPKEIPAADSLEVNKPIDEQVSKVIEEIETPTPLVTEIPQVGDVAVNSYHTISGGPETLKEASIKNPSEPIQKQTTTFRVGGEPYKDPRIVIVKKQESTVSILPFIFLLLGIGAVAFFIKETGMTLEQAQQISSVFKGIVSSALHNIFEAIKERGAL